MNTTTPPGAAMQKVTEKGSILDDIQEDVSRIGAADVVVGIPTHNDRETIALVADAVLAAAGTTLSGSRVAVVHADGASQDGTAERLREVTGERVPLLQVRYPVYPADLLAAPLAGVPGRREAALTIFQLARQLGAKACVLLDAGVETVSAEWVDRLALPILDGAVDLAAPTYVRGAFDGLINSGIATPFARALFGKRLRQPSGADMAYSTALMDFHLSGAARPLDPWSTIPAITNDFRVGQASLGARVVRQRDVRPDLSGTLRQALGALFEEMELTASYWQKVRGSEAVAWFGPAIEIEPPPSDFNRKPMVDAFRQGCKDLMEIWKLLLPPASLLELRRLERQPDAGFRMADDFWAQLIYDFAVAYHMRAIGRDHLLEAMTPLYLGWAASFTGEMQSASAAEVEQRLERLAVQFETQKRRLISRWRWPDRFNP
jgi:hypothetical protein